MHDFFQVLIQPMGVIGLIGQMCFFSRFLVQWIASERQGRSTIPQVFWYLSMAGGTLVLLYAIWQRDPVFTLGQSVGLVVYMRNLVLIYRAKRPPPAASPASSLS